MFKASAVKDFTGPHTGNASRDRLLRVRGFTTRATGLLTTDSSSLDDSSKTLQIGPPFATLFKLRSDRHQPVQYSIGILVQHRDPSRD